MSTYTTQLRFICEEYAKRSSSAPYGDIPGVISAARPKIFDFSYPLYDPSYKAALETKIINHFFFREIGAETVAQFKFMLARTLNEVMPYYNDLYRSAALEYDPLLTADYKKTGYRKEDQTKDTKHSGTDKDRRDDHLKSVRTDDLTATSTPGVTTTTTTTDEHKNDTWEMVSDTPQGGLTGARSEEYLSNVKHTQDQAGVNSKVTAETEYEGYDTLENTGDVTTEDTGYQTTQTEYGHEISDKGGSVADYWEEVKGKYPGESYAALIREYREAIINIDMLVINELESCFMNIY